MFFIVINIYNTLISEMTGYVSDRTLHPTQSLTVYTIDRNIGRKYSKYNNIMKHKHESVWNTQDVKLRKKNYTVGFVLKCNQNAFFMLDCSLKFAGRLKNEKPLPDMPCCL